MRNTLKDLTEAENAKIVLDHSEVTLADRNAVMFLAIWEIKGLELKTCPTFLREWATKERVRIRPWHCRWHSQRYQWRSDRPANDNRRRGREFVDENTNFREFHKRQ
jgi:hypothetical protein